MVKLNDIHPAKGSNKKALRLGRGVGSGTGKTAGRGYNGAGSRVGSGTKPYFEGGQTSLIRRIPKRGFTNIFRKIYQVVNIGDIDKVDMQGKDVDCGVLFEMGLVGSAKIHVKVLGNGECTKNITVRAHAFSKSAREKIEKAKGKAEVISGASA
ncbi:MAG TPA: 50S ribosomal protein L15 [Fibrobacteres bacterium]|jgi:large subunit ribosomal protein L15|nr:50S ribosomal protein L15 [Fibrobacterota bacterium]